MAAVMAALVGIVLVFPVTTVRAAPGGGSPYGIAEAAATVADELGASLRGTAVAVLDPEPLESAQSDLRGLGRVLGEELRHALTGRRHVTVLEVARVDEALEELRITQRDLFDRQHRNRFGRLTGTQVILTGRLVELANAIEWEAQAVRVETGELAAGAAVQIRRDADTFRLRGLAVPALLRLDAGGLSEVYVDGESAGATNHAGRLEIEVAPGRHRVEIRREGYAWQAVWINLRAGESRELAVVLEALPDPGGAALRSLLIPGWGDLYLGHADFWIYPIVVYGSLYAANRYRDKVDEMVWVEDPDTGRESLEKRGWWPVYGLLALGIGVWVYDIGHVHEAAERIRARNTSYRPTLTIGPDLKNEGLLVSVRQEF